MPQLIEEKNKPFSFKQAKQFNFINWVLININLRIFCWKLQFYLKKKINICFSIFFLYLKFFIFFNILYFDRNNHNKSRDFDFLVPFLKFLHITNMQMEKCIIPLLRITTHINLIIFNKIYTCQINNFFFL